MWWEMGGGADCFSLSKTREFLDPMSKVNISIEAPHATDQIQKVTNYSMQKASVICSDKCKYVETHFLQSYYARPWRVHAFQ